MKSRKNPLPAERPAQPDSVALPQISYFDVLLGRYTRYQDDIEADGAGPLSVMEYRNRVNMANWQNKFREVRSRAPTVVSPSSPGVIRWLGARFS